MEEYIRLEEEKARRRGKVYKWETATYDKIWYDEDVHDLISVENEFSAIVFNDALTSEVEFSCEPTIIIMEYLLKISKKACILELKRRYFEDYYSDILYVIFIKEDTVYLCLYFTKDHEGNKINTSYPEKINTRGQEVQLTATCTNYVLSNNCFAGCVLSSEDLRPNGEALRKCILRGPYKPTTVLVQAVDSTNDSPAILEHTTVKTPMNMSPENKAHFKAEKEAIHLILTGIGDEIYSTPEWSRFVAIVKQQHKLDEVSYRKLFEILKQCQKEVNELHAERLARNANPLALVATAQANQDPYYQTSRSHKSYAPSSKPSIPTRSHTSTRHKGKEIAKPITPLPKITSEEDSDHEQAQRDKDMQKNLALISKKPKRVKDSAYHKEKMLLCKQAEQGVPLQSEKYDWLVDTDEEFDEQELEAHYNYMAKIHEVPTADTDTDSEPVEKVQNDAGYNVFANDLQHSEQFKSASNTCLVETDDSNVIPDSPDMCEDDIQNDQNDVESDDKRVALANLIANLKFYVNEYKKIQKQLKKANTTLAQELKDCKTILVETRVNYKTNVSRPQHRSNQLKDKVLSNNSQVKLKKTQVEVHHGIPSVSNKKKSVTTCNLKLLCNFVEKFLGTVHFGNDQFEPILSYADLVQGNVTINRVYYIEGLNHNLFSVGQFCDADLEVAFRKSTCFVRDLQGYSTQSKGYRVYNKRTGMIVESIHIRFHKIKGVSKTSISNDTSGLVPQRQKASNYDNSYPVPQRQDVSSLAYAHVPSQQDLDLLSGPLYDEFFNTDHPLEQVRGNPSRPVKTRRQLATDPEMCMFALTVSTTEVKNIKEAMADSTWIEAMQEELHQFDRLQFWELGSSFGLTAFPYVHHTGCIDSHKSNSGGIQFRGDKLVSWMSKKQNCTAISSAEIEYVELSTSCAQVMWIRIQLQDYGFNSNKIPLYCDSQSAIAISCNRVQHFHTKHIHTRYHFIKEQVENDIIELYFVKTEYQLADMFTKAIPEDRFKYLVRRIEHLSDTYVFTMKIEILLEPTSNKILVAESDSITLAHAQTTKTYQASRFKNQESSNTKTKTSANSDKQDLPQDIKYIVPTNRVIVPTGRYIVHTGRVIVPIGRYVVPAATLDFKNVYYVKELQQFNLFSISQICDKKNQVLFTDTECLVLSKDLQLPDNSMMILKVPRKHNLYTINLNDLSSKGNLACLVVYASFDESLKWHRRMAHVNYKNINRLVKGNLVRGLPSKLFKNGHTCIVCCKDLFGPTSIRSIDHKYYCLVITDDYKNQLNIKVKAISCDNDTKFENAQMIDLYGSKGIKMEYSNPRTLQQNEVVKRKNKALIEAARTMLANSKLLTMLWTEAVRTAWYVLNRVSVTSPYNKTPYALLTGNIPTVSHFKPFGCHVTILNTSDHLGKFNGKADEGYIVGYSANTPGDKVDDSPFPSADKIFQKELARLTVPTSNVPVPTGSLPVHTSSIPVPAAAIMVPADDVLVHSSSSTDSIFNGEPITRFHCPSDLGNHNLSLGIFSSLSYDDEFDTALNNVASSMEVSPVATKRINTIHPQSQIISDPTFVVQKQSKVLIDFPNGHHQEEGIDYDEVFAPVARIEAIRLFLAFTSYMGFLVYQMDVKSAFLYGRIEEEVYVTQPKGFVDPRHPKKVYKVVKALYRLHQAPRAWTATTPYKAPKPNSKNESDSHVNLHLYRSMIAYSDSDYARENKDRKSTTGGCQFLGRRLISWQCKKQTIMATSSTEAEYVAAANCCGQLWSTATLRAPELGPPAILATIDKTPYTITKELVRSRLQLADDGGVTNLPILDIYSGMDNLGYVPEGKLTFFKKKFSPQGMVSNIRNAKKFLMYPKMLQIILVALVLEHDHRFDQHETTTGSFPSRNNAPLRGDFHLSPPRSSHTPPVGCRGKLVKKVKTLEVKLKTKKRKMVVSDSDQEDGTTQNVDLDALRALANAAVAVDSDIPSGHTSYVPTASPCAPPAGPTGPFEVPPAGLTGTSEVPFAPFAIPPGASDAPTGALNVSTATSAVPADSLKVPATVPTNSPYVPAGVSSKGKYPMVEEDFPFRAMTFRQMEEHRLGEEATKRLHEEEMSEMKRERAEAKRKRKQEVLESAKFYNEADWLNIRAQLEANASLSKTLLGDDRPGPVVDEPSIKRSKSPEASTPSIPEVSISPAVTSTPSSRTRQKSLGRMPMHKPKSTLPNLDLDAPSQTFLKVVIDEDSDDEDSIDEVWSAVVGWELLSTPLDRQDLMKLYGLVVQYYDHHPAAGAGLLFWGDLHVLFDSQAVGKGSCIWNNQNQWEIISWRLYTLLNLHVLEIVFGEVLSMFTDVSYPLSVELMKKMLMHKLEIDSDFVGNDLTITEQLIQFIKTQLVAAQASSSIPDDHVVDFHYMDDARDIWNAVKARFSGNAKSKKMRKSMLKQEFSEFRISKAEGLHKRSQDAGDGGEFALMGITSEFKLTGTRLKLWKTKESSSTNQLTFKDKIRVLSIELENTFNLLKHSERINADVKTAKKDLQTKLDNHLARTEKKNKLGWDDSAFSVFTTTSKDVKGRPIFHSDKSSKDNTNDLASSDSSLKSSKHKPTNSTSYASTSSVSTSVNEAEIKLNVGTPIKESISVQDLPIFTCKSFDKNEHTSRTSCNKNGYSNKKAGHFKKYASSFSKLCFVCGSATHRIKDCDFYEKQMANTTVGIGVGPAVRPQPVPTGKPKVTPVLTGRPNRPFPVPTDRGYSPLVISG
uniref:Integrase catalytic domain-containing protein n=1 Tax=Tanacetum cinerariifolium TaxID=118510 RepID=A0A6L2K1K6_TANCI|nr:hypothetical protein [Tanacetum cinerariifolium]